MKTLYNKSCRYYFIESRTVEFVFFRFFYDFISILQVHYLMRPKRHDLNVIFFTFRSCRPLDGRQAPCRPLGGRQAPIFKNFPIRHIFLKFCFFKYKNEKSATPTGRIQASGPRWLQVLPLAPPLRVVVSSSASVLARTRGAPLFFSIPIGTLSYL